MKKYIFILTLVLPLFSIAGCGKSDAIAQGIPPAPSGKNCSENVAYLQGGVNRYTVAFGNTPVEVDELLAQKDSKGPFVEKIPVCPSGSRYIIENGIVKESL